MTTGQSNLWRADVRQAILAALRAYAKFSPYNAEFERFAPIRRQVLRATFIAKFDGEEYSRIKR
jgi:hypothetical protein